MTAIDNLVHQTSTSTGTSNLTLAAVNGKQSFATAFSTGSTTDVFHYFISNRSAAEWERGTGHMSDSTTLVRDTVIESTNSDNAVDFSAGTKDVTNDIPAGSQLQAATDAQVRAATTGGFGIKPSHIETASATVALTDAATVAVDWDTGVNFTLTVTANRAIGNPTNGQPGTWRSILVQGNDATDRTITFGNQYGGDVPTITDCDSTKKYLILIYCKTSSQFLAFARNGSDA